MQPIRLDVLDALIATSDLAAEVRDAMPTFELAWTVKEWRRDRDDWGWAP